MAHCCLSLSVPCAMAHCTCSRTAQRSTWRLRGRWRPLRQRTTARMGAPAAVPTLQQPPDLGEALRPRPPPLPTTPEQKLANLFRTTDGQPVRTITHQKNIGSDGSKHKARALLLDPLALGGSTPAEGVDTTLMKLVFGLSFLAWSEYGLRQMLDRRWCDAYAAAARHIAAVASSGREPHDGGPCRVCVLGLGGCIPALVAAQSGCSVLWVERIARFEEVARALVARNHLEAHVRTVRVKGWAEAVDTHVHSGSAPARRFDAVITDEVSEDLLGEIRSR